MSAADAILPSVEDVSTSELRRCSCGAKMSQPRLLSCLHVMGECCLKIEPLHDKFVVQCRLCLAETVVMEDNIDLLPEPLFLYREEEAEREKMGKKPACQLCSTDTEATVYCEDCQQYLCDSHQGLHKQIPALRSHVIKKLDKSFQSPARSFCRKHYNLLRYFCETCLCAVCSECKVTTHAGHNLKFLKNVLEAADAKMNEELAKLTKTQTSLQAEKSEFVPQAEETSSETLPAEMKEFLPKHVGSELEKEGHLEEKSSKSFVNQFEKYVEVMQQYESFSTRRIQQIQQFGSSEERLLLCQMLKQKKARFLKVGEENEQRVLLQLLPPEADTKAVRVLTNLDISQNDREDKVVVAPTKSVNPGEKRDVYVRTELPLDVDKDKFHLCVESGALSAAQKWNLLEVGCFVYLRGWDSLKQVLSFDGEALTFKVHNAEYKWDQLENFRIFSENLTC